MLFQSVLPWEGSSQRSRELKQQRHFDVRSAVVFVGVIFLSLGGLFYICSKLPLVPVNVSVSLDLSVVCGGSGCVWCGGGEGGRVECGPPQRDFFL